MSEGVFELGDERAVRRRRGPLKAVVLAGGRARLAPYPLSTQTADADRRPLDPRLVIQPVRDLASPTSLSASDTCPT
jgi:hypothetical protein